MRGRSGGARVGQASVIGSFALGRHGAALSIGGSKVTAVASSIVAGGALVRTFFSFDDRPCGRSR